MKILQVIAALEPNGAEILLANCLIAFKKHSISIELLVLSSPKNDSLVRLLLEHGIGVQCLSYRSHLDPRAFFVLRKYIKNNHFDIIHCHLFPAYYYVVFCRTNNTKLIITEHSTSNQRRSRLLFKKIEQIIYPQFETIICIGTSVKNALEKWVPSISNKIKVIPNGIPLDQFYNSLPCKREVYSIPDDVFLLAMVSRIEKPAKDHETLIRSLVFLPHVHLAIIGSGKHEKDAQVLVKELGLEKRVHFLGHHSDVGALIKMADAVVHSCNFEGFGLAIIEAMACGKPVVATNLESIRELITDELNGLTFKKNDPEDLSYKVAFLMKNPDKLRLIGENGKKSVKRFSIDTMVSLLYSEYEKLCKPI